MTIRFPNEPATTAQLASGRRAVTRRVHARRRAARIAVIGGVLLGASSLTAATLVVAQASHQEIATSVTCYSHDDLGSFSSGVGMAQAQGEPFQEADLQTKKEMCGLVWKSGLKQAAATGGTWPDVAPNTSTIRVPPLAMCNLANGTTGGFPIERPQTPQLRSATASDSLSSASPVLDSRVSVNDRPRHAFLLRPEQWRVVLRGSCP